jgi:hypothetical protein
VYLEFSVAVVDLVNFTVPLVPSTVAFSAGAAAAATEVDAEYLATGVFPETVLVANEPSTKNFAFCALVIVKVLEVAEAIAAQPAAKVSLGSAT